MDVMTVRPMSCISGDENWAEVPKGGLLYSQHRMDKSFFWTWTSIRFLFVAFFGTWMFTQAGKSSAQGQNGMYFMCAVLLAGAIWNTVRGARKAFAPSTKELPPRDPPTL